jgi:hypothetical protein
VPSIKKQLRKPVKVLKIVTADGSAFTLKLFRNRAALAAENVFLRRQLALFQERKQKAQRTIAADPRHFEHVSALLQLARGLW